MKSVMNVVNLIAVICSALLVISCDDSGLHYIERDREKETGNAEFSYTENSDEPVSFGTQTIGTVKYYDGYVYIVSDTLYRVNVSTGNVTTVCQDPICVHDSENCPLYGIGGSSIYYLSDDGSVCFPGSRGFVRYDAAKMKTVLLDDYDGATFRSFGPEIYCGDYRIYDGFEYDAGKDEATYGVRRADLKNGGSSFFGGMTGADGKYVTLTAQPWFNIGDRLYFEDGENFFSLDKEGGDRRDLFAKKSGGRIFTDGEFIYYQEADDFTNIWRRGLEGGEAEIVVRDFYSPGTYMLTDEYIYYMKPDGDDVVLGKADIRGYAADEVRITPLVICRSRHDGSGEERLALVTDIEKGLSPLGWIVVGNYFYCEYSYWEDADGDGIFTDGDNKYSTMITSGGAVCRLMRVDLTTGDIYIFSITG